MGIIYMINKTLQNKVFSDRRSLKKKEKSEIHILNHTQMVSSYWKSNIDYARKQSWDMMLNRAGGRVSGFSPSVQATFLVF